MPGPKRVWCILYSLVLNSLADCTLLFILEESFKELQRKMQTFLW